MLEASVNREVYIVSKIALGQAYCRGFKKQLLLQGNWFQEAQNVADLPQGA